MGEAVFCGWLEGFCFVVGRLGAGLGPVLEDDEVEVELEVELEDEDEDEDEDDDEDDDEDADDDELELGTGALGVVLELVVVLDELLLSGTQLSVSETVPGTGGTLRFWIGVPDGTLGNTKVWV